MSIIFNKDFISDEEPSFRRFDSQLKTATESTNLQNSSISSTVMSALIGMFSTLPSTSTDAETLVDSYNGADRVVSSFVPSLTFCGSPPNTEVNPTVYYIYCIVYLSVWFAIVCGGYFLYNFNRQLKMVQTFCSNISEKNSGITSTSGGVDSGDGNVSQPTPIMEGIKSWFTRDDVREIDGGGGGGNKRERKTPTKSYRRVEENENHPLLIRKVIDENKDQRTEVSGTVIEGVKRTTDKSHAKDSAAAAAEKIVLKEISTFPLNAALELPTSIASSHLDTSSLSTTLSSVSASSSDPKHQQQQNEHPYDRETVE